MDNQIINREIHFRMNKKLRRKQAELLDLLNQMFILKNETTPKIIYKYEVMFGKLEDELFTLNLICSKYEKVLERILVKAKRGQRLTLEQIESIEKEMLNSREEAKRRKNILSPNEIKLETNNKMDSEYNESLIMIFRSLVKYLHPDSQKIIRDFDKYWELVLEAYKNKDLTRSKIFYNMVLSNENLKESDKNFLKKYSKEIWQIKRRMEFEKRKIDRIVKEEPLCLINEIDRKEWIDNRRLKLENKILSLKIEIDNHKDTLIRIKSGDLIELESSEDLKFQENFRSNTYFKI